MVVCVYVCVCPCVLQEAIVRDQVLSLINLHQGCRDCRIAFSHQIVLVLVLGQDCEHNITANTGHRQTKGMRKCGERISISMMYRTISVVDLSEILEGKERANCFCELQILQSRCTQTTGKRLNFFGGSVLYLMCWKS